MTYFCTATCSLVAIYRLMEANFQQYSCWVADFNFQPVVLQVCGEPRSSGVVHVLHNWFSAFGNYHISRTLQLGCVIVPWSQTSRKLGINSISHQPAGSGSIAIVGLDCLRVGNILLRRPSKVLVPFSLDMLAVRTSQLREISGPVATPTWNFSTNIGSLSRSYFTFFFYFRQYCGQSYLH